MGNYMDLRKLLAASIERTKLRLGLEMRAQEVAEAREADLLQRDSAELRQLFDRRLPAAQQLTVLWDNLLDPEGSLNHDYQVILILKNEDPNFNSNFLKFLTKYHDKENRAEVAKLLRLYLKRAEQTEVEDLVLQDASSIKACDEESVMVFYLGKQLAKKPYFPELLASIEDRFAGAKKDSKQASYYASLWLAIALNRKDQDFDTALIQGLEAKISKLPSATTSLGHRHGGKLIDYYWDKAHAFFVQSDYDLADGSKVVAPLINLFLKSCDLEQKKLLLQKIYDVQTPKLMRKVWFEGLAASIGIRELRDFERSFRTDPNYANFLENLIWNCATNFKVARFFLLYYPNLQALLERTHYPVDSFDRAFGLKHITAWIDKLAERPNRVLQDNLLYLLAKSDYLLGKIYSDRDQYGEQIEILESWAKA